MVPLIVTEPSAATDTDSEFGSETSVPRASTASAGVAVPFAVLFAVLTFKLQGSTRTVLPVASGESAGKVDEITWKMHEPKVVLPVAAPADVLMLKAGVVPVPVKDTVVGSVVPNAGTPPEKENGVPTTAATVLVLIGAVMEGVVTVTVGGGGALSLPPQAASDEKTAKHTSVLRAFFMMISLKSVTEKI